MQLHVVHPLVSRSSRDPHHRSNFQSHSFPPRARECTPSSVPSSSSNWWKRKFKASCTSIRSTTWPECRVNRYRASAPASVVTCFARFGNKIIMFFSHDSTGHVPSLEGVSDDSQRLPRQGLDHLWCLSLQSSRLALVHRSSRLQKMCHVKTRGVSCHPVSQFVKPIPACKTASSIPPECLPTRTYPWRIV